MARANVHGGTIRRLTNAVLLAFAIGLSLVSLQGSAGAYNDYDNQCGVWTGGNPIGIQWKWGTSINPSGNWGYAFASVAEPRWDDYFGRIQLGYSSSASSTFDWYWNQYDGASGKALVNCGFGYPDGTIDDFHAYGNLYWHNDVSYDPLMGNVAGHEIGHGLGLGHSHYDAVMRGNYLHSGWWPTSDDYSAMNQKYP